LLAIGVLGAGSVDEDGDVSRGLAALFGFGGLLVVRVVALLAIVQVGAFATASLRAIAGERVTLADCFLPRHVLQLLVPALVDEDGDVSRGLAALFGFGGLLVVVVVALLAIVQVGAFATASLRTIAGERVTFAAFFRPRNVLQLLVLAVIVGLASALLAITGI